MESFGEAAQKLLAKLEARIAEKKVSRRPETPGEIESGEPSVVSVNGEPSKPTGRRKSFTRLPADAGDGVGHKDRAGAPRVFEFRMGNAAQGRESNPLVTRALPAAQARRRELKGSWVGLAANDNRDHARALKW